MKHSMICSLMLSLFVSQANAGIPNEVAGYYIVVASTPIPNASTAVADANVRSRVISQAAHCGFEIYNDFSFKFGTFRPGFIAYVIGEGNPFTKKFALENLRKAKPCFPNAYMKYGYEPGE